jgi:predicted O-methyltransferase YrrM
LSPNPYADEILELMRTLVDYRMSPVRQMMEKVTKAGSMLHVDVLMLIYHFAKISRGQILEIGSFLGGSAIAAALGARESGVRKQIITVEPGGRLKGHRLASRNIFKDLKKNLARFGVAEEVTAINGFSYEPSTISAIREAFAPGEVGFFIFDADDKVGRDLNCYGDLLADDCWVLIDDYVGTTEKAGPTRAAVDPFVASGRLVPLGYYGWSTWVGRWRLLG